MAHEMKTRLSRGLMELPCAYMKFTFRDIGGFDHSPYEMKTRLSRGLMELPQYAREVYFQTGGIFVGGGKVHGKLDPSLLLFYSGRQPPPQAGSLQKRHYHISEELPPLSLFTQVGEADSTCFRQCIFPFELFGGWEWGPQQTDPCRALSDSEFHLRDVVGVDPISRDGIPSLVFDFEKNSFDRTTPQNYALPEAAMPPYLRSRLAFGSEAVIILSGDCHLAQRAEDGPVFRHPLPALHLESRLDGVTVLLILSVVCRATAGIPS
ncbi:hypothetical protein CEXT_33501 [Caerostris extrusa]|uniref:Uncharacterized protein n=1 Tax=Caerostris extrusa TaxID=172846 RepID=A0AAV4PQ35_CAEEX|nr:hypothetical protein CEXT_33501 [Caerostris extrusa]